VQQDRKRETDRQIVTEVGEKERDEEGEKDVEKKGFSVTVVQQTPLDIVYEWMNGTDSKTSSMDFNEWLEKVEWMDVKNRMNYLRRSYVKNFKNHTW